MTRNACRIYPGRQMPTAGGTHKRILEVAIFTRAISSVTMGQTNIPSGSNISSIRRFASAFVHAGQSECWEENP